MRRTVVMLMMMCAVLATPIAVGADDQAMPPAATGHPTPPARSTLEVHPLASGLVDTGMIIPRESSQLTQSQPDSPAPHRRARMWTWDEIDHNSVRSTSD